MLRQCKVAIKFHSPVLGTDVHDGEEILSDKHWVIAEVMKLESGQVTFENYDEKVVASWLAEGIETIRHNVLDGDSQLSRLKSHSTTSARSKISDLLPGQSGPQ